MKYSAVALAAFVAVASAQADISIIPSCAIPCIDDAAAKATDCKPQDFKCICENQETIVPAATTCVLSKCGNDVALNKVLPATETFCKEVLAGGGDEPTVSSTTAAPKPESTTTTAVPESTAAPSSSSSYEESSAAPESSSAAPSVYPTASITKNVSSSAAPSTSAPAATTSAVTAGAAGVAGSLGLLLLGAVAAL